MRISFVAVLLLVLLCEALAIAEPPAATVQLSDTRDAAGKFSNWTTIPATNLTWDATSVTSIPDMKVIDDDSVQDWYFQDMDGNWWHVKFRRSKRGEYAIRYCWGAEEADSVWSEISVVYLMLPPRPRHQ